MKRLLLITSLCLWSWTATPAWAADRCDLNGNGAADAPDIQLLVNDILAGITPAAYDLNQDTFVNIADIQTLVNTLLGVSTCPA